ncbi:MAG: YhbY family RNA-binding protein [Candidatus Pacearchaeota archaeon]|jgi:RNA-binding protein
MVIREFQLGKNGLTENFLENLRNSFKKSKSVKISVLRSCCRDKKELKEISEKIVDSLGKNYTFKTIGYTINLKKWRKDVRE